MSKLEPWQGRILFTLLTIGAGMFQAHVPNAAMFTAGLLEGGWVRRALTSSFIDGFITGQHYWDVMEACGVGPP